MKDTGGPAFPAHPSAMGDHDGMTLRDYFAAQAIRPQPVFPSNLWQAVRWALGMQYLACGFNPKQRAQQAYAIADALLEERDQ